MLKKKKPKSKKEKVFPLSLSFFPQKVARAENIVDEQKEIQAREICENKNQRLARRQTDEPVNTTKLMRESNRSSGAGPVGLASGNQQPGNKLSSARRQWPAPHQQKFPPAVGNTYGRGFCLLLTPNTIDITPH